MQTRGIRGIARVAVTFAIVTFSLGCGVVPSEENATDPANGTGKVKGWAFTLALSKQNMTMVQGATDTSIVTITRTGGFTGAVSLTAMMPPNPGFTVTFENVTSTGAVTTARMLVAVPSAFFPLNGIVFGVVGKAVSSDVEDADATMTFSVTRKPGTFTNVSPTLSVGRGQQASLRVSLIRTNYDAPVPMNLVTTQAGITASFLPNPVLDTVTQMTVSVDPSVPEGTYNVGVRASEGTPVQGTAPLLITVTAPGTIGLSFNLPLLIVLRGSATPTALNIARTNYSGPVTFTVTGLPPGATTTFPQGTTGNSASCSFSAGSAPAGDYVITVTGSAPGIAPATATLTLRITG